MLLFSNALSTGTASPSPEIFLALDVASMLLVVAGMRPFCRDGRSTRSFFDVFLLAWVFEGALLVSMLVSPLQFTCSSVFALLLKLGIPSYRALDLFFHSSKFITRGWPMMIVRPDAYCTSVFLFWVRFRCRSGSVRRGINGLSRSLGLGAFSKGSGMDTSVCVACHCRLLNWRRYR
jgi:hypothetical protein